MERKKSISIILLSMTVLLIAAQVSMTSNACDQIFDVNDSLQSPGLPKDPINFSVNALNFTLVDSIEPVWFYVNLIMVILTPVAMILTGILIKKKSTAGIPSDKLEDTDEAVDELKLLDNPETGDKNGRLLARLGMLFFFIQNIVILIMYILFFVLIPVYNDPQAPINVIRTYLILLELDFVGAILIAVGLIILSLKLDKNKIFGYLAAGSWIAFIGLAVYPRIEMIIGFTGDLSSATILEYGEELLEYLTSFYGVDVMLQTFGHCFLALSLFFTARFLGDNFNFKGKGILNSFGIINYVAGSLMNLLLLTILTFGITMTPEALGMIAILYLIVLTIKLIAVPIVGLISGIMGFNRLKPQKT